MRRNPERRTPRGFTLLEVIVALAIVGVVLTLAWRMLTQLGDSRDMLERSSRDVGATANGLRLLSAVVMNAEARDSSRFTGDTTQADFGSWCMVPAGWIERCQVTLSLKRSTKASEATLSLNGGRVLRVWHHTGQATLRYLDAANRDQRWIGIWSSALAVPGAIALIAGADTLVLMTGDQS